MKFYLNWFDNSLNKPSLKFSLNLFFLKFTQYFSLKQLNFLHIFLNIQNLFLIKTFKLNYTLHNIVIISFFCLNIVLQLFIFFCYKCYHKLNFYL